MDTKELRGKAIKDLRKALDEAVEKLDKLKLDIAQDKNKKVHQVKTTKKEVARILTILREKQWEEFEKQNRGKNEK